MQKREATCAVIGAGDYIGSEIAKKFAATVGLWKMMRAIRVRTSSMHSQDAPIEALPIKYLHLPSAACSQW